MREDILGGLKNAIERGESIQEAKDSFIAAGYPKTDVEDAAAALENLRQGKKETSAVPALYTATLQTPALSQKPQPAKEGKEIKPLPQIKVKTTFNYLLLIPIVLISALIAYLIYSIFLAQ